MAEQKQPVLKFVCSEHGEQETTLTQFYLYDGGIFRLTYAVAVHLITGELVDSFMRVRRREVRWVMEAIEEYG